MGTYVVVYCVAEARHAKLSRTKAHPLTSGISYFSASDIRLVHKQAGEFDAQGYVSFVSDLKQKITSARHRASSRSTASLFCSTGPSDAISSSDRNRRAGAPRSSTVWLGRAFPEMTGLSARNLKYMRAFADAWPDGEFVQQVVALLRDIMSASSTPSGTRPRETGLVRAADDRTRLEPERPCPPSRQ